MILKDNFTQNHTAAAAAKSLQSCPTLCDTVDGSPPGSPVPGILQAPTFTSIKKKLVLGQVSQFRVSLSRESLSLQFCNLKSWLADPLGLKSKSRGECFKIYKRSAVRQQTLWMKKTNENKVRHGNMTPPPQSTKL